MIGYVAFAHLIKKSIFESQQMCFECESEEENNERD